MSWRTAFLLQAKSDNAVRRLLNQPDIPYSHRLHYLQMVTEKLAKGFLADDRNKTMPPQVHRSLVRMLQTLKMRPEIRRRLGYKDTESFRRFMNSLLVTAEKIESLAPSIAGTSLPNPEYPWRDPDLNEVLVPCEYSFPLFAARSGSLIKLDRLIEALLETVE